MIRLIRRLSEPAMPAASLTLPLEQRVRSRLRVTLDDGREAGLFLERGQVMRDGDLLASEEGLVVQVRAAPEPVSSVYCQDARQLARLCYHLGNRHVPLQIDVDRVRYQQDHVLDELVRGLGLVAIRERAPFEPEPGAHAAPHHADDREHAH